MATPRAHIDITAADKTRQAIDQAKRNLQSLGDTATALPARFGTLGAAIAGAFTAVTLKGALDTLDRLDDLSEKTGIATQSLSALRYAGEVTGTPLEAIANSTRKLAANMSEAAGGNKEMVATFKALGVAVTNADGSLRSQDAVLLDLADRFAGYEDGAGKAALAQKVFGKSGAEMIPLLNQGAAGIRALRAEAEGLGAVYGGEVAKQAATFNDNLKKLELASEGLKVSLLGGLLPALNKLVEGFIRLKEAGVLWVAMKDAAKGVVGANRLTDDPGADLQNLARERERIEKRRAFALKKQLPTRDIDDELFQLDELREVAKIRQRMRAIDGVGDASDAQSRRLRSGARGQAPIVSTGDDKEAKAAERELKERAKLVAELAGLTGSFAEDWARLNEMFRKGDLNLQQLTAAQAKLLEQQPFMRERVQAEKELADTRARIAAMADQSLAQLAAENDALAENNRTLAEQVEEIGLTADHVDMLRLARLDAKIAAEQENLVAAQNIENNEREIEQIQRRIVLLQNERFLRDRAGTEGRMVEGRDKQAAESKQFADDLSSDLKGALQRAFEDSKNPAKAFTDALASTLYTRVSSALADALTKQLLGNMATGGAGGFGGLLGGLFSGSWASSAGFGSGAAFGNMDLGLFLHGGGIVGTEATFRRPVSSAVFAGAPRYHSGGIAGDEVPAILQRGEGVFTQAQMKALGGRGGRGVSVSMPVTVNVDSRSDRAAVMADIHQVTARNNEQLIEQLRAAGALA